MVLSKGLFHGRGLPESVVVALKVKFTTREFGWANSTWMCSAPPTPLFRNSFSGEGGVTGFVGSESDCECGG